VSIRVHLWLTSGVGFVALRVFRGYSSAGFSFRAIRVFRGCLGSSAAGFPNIGKVKPPGFQPLEKGLRGAAKISLAGGRGIFYISKRLSVIK
jgi:hypothetical protein